jgi:hypothetical protein
MCIDITDGRRPVEVGPSADTRTRGDMERLIELDLKQKWQLNIQKKDDRSMLSIVTA